MPATEETYRKQTTLHVVFAVSSIAMAVVTVWMILSDHLRPWKTVQREFHRVETAKLEAAEQDKLKEQQSKSRKQIDALDKQIAEVERAAQQQGRKIGGHEATIDQLTGKFDGLDTRRKFQKAELDSLRSFYDGMIDREERGRAKEFLQNSIIPAEVAFEATVKQYEAAGRDLSRAKLNKGLRESQVVEVSDAPPPGTPADQAGFKKGDVLSVEGFEALRNEAEAALKSGAMGETKTFETTVTRVDAKGRESKKNLSVPVKPAVAKDSAGKLESGFETVGLPVTPITADVLRKRREDLTRDVDRVQRTLAQKQAQYGDGGIVNQAFAALRGLPIMDLAAPPEKIQQISLPELLINYNFKEVPRYDRCTTCHLGIDRPGFDKDAEGKPMASVYHSHPHLGDGATAVDPKGNVVPAGLYLDSSGPHPINKFGCTICHGGQGSGTSFTFASHTPNTLEEKEKWEHEQDWYEMHHWDEPMLPERFIESSCVKCHHQVTDVPQAKKLQAGYERITKYGCTGCHTIGGEGSFGPDLTDNRQVGPNLKHLASKVTKDWALKWIKNPHAFRPDTRMPRFYEVTNNDSPKDQPKVHAEIHAMTHYLFAASEPPKDFVDPPSPGDAAKGKDLFFAKGCMACHAHKDYSADAVPEAARPFTKANFGPNLSNIAAKFDESNGFKWLANWLKSPEAYHPKSLMPNLQLSWEESADIARYLLSVKAETIPPRWSEAEFQVPKADSPEVAQGLNDLVKLYLGKSKTYRKRTVLLSEVESTIAGMTLDEKLLYVGEKTISRLGCFGCHNIKGYETAKPIGTPLNGWGVKSPAKLDFGHIAEYLTDHLKRLDPAAASAKGIVVKDEGKSPPCPPRAGAKLASDDKAHPLGKSDDKVNDYDGTDEFYKEKLDDHTRMGFLYQKVHRPRSYDYGKNNEDLKAWDDRLRMPQFSWADDPKAIEEVMTLVLGLTGERIPGKYMPKTFAKPDTVAKAQGEKLLDRFNCRGCHVLAMPKYSLAQGTKTLDALPDFLGNVSASYNKRSSDYLSFYGKDNPEFAAVGGLSFDPKVQEFRLEEQVFDQGRTSSWLQGPRRRLRGRVVDPKTTLILANATEGKAVT